MASAGPSSSFFVGRPDLPLALIAVAGPRPVSLKLGDAERYTIGRRASHDLPLEHPEVSKNHAVIIHRSKQKGHGWFLADLGSKHGTRLNGVPLQVDRECPIMPGDLIEISPWTFCIMAEAEGSSESGRLSTIDDTLAIGSTVASIESEGSGELAQERLRLLLHCAESLQRARDLPSLAEIILNAAVAGTGYANAAMMRPMTPNGEVELITSRGEIRPNDRHPRISRSLIRAASQGVPVHLTGASRNLREAMSIAEFNIQEAICVPLMVESAVAGFLYLDSRGRRDGGTLAASEACAFAAGIGRLASMAWANLMRLELERRYAQMEGELAAGARAQQLILPAREGTCGRLRYIGQCRPGRVIAGDFFDVFELPDGKVAVTIGDVTGKGVPASVVMTTTQGFLHGALRQHGDLARAMHDLNAYVFARREARIFVTLWAGVFDLQRQSLAFSDAGHGYAWMLNHDGTMTALVASGGPPIAVSLDVEYHTTTIELETCGRMLLASDGIIEQPAAGSGPGAAHDHGDQFGRSRVEACLRSMPANVDEVAALFEAVQSHAGTEELADDATVVLVRW